MTFLTIFILYYSSYPEDGWQPFRGKEFGDSVILQGLTIFTFFHFTPAVHLLLINTPQIRGCLSCNNCSLIIIPQFLIISHSCLSSVCTAMCSTMHSSLLHTSSARLEMTCQHATDKAICLRHTITDWTGDGMDLCSRMLLRRLACCSHRHIST